MSVPKRGEYEWKLGEYRASTRYTDGTGSEVCAGGVVDSEVVLVDIV